MALPRELALDADVLDDLMRSTWLMRIATVGPGQRINLTPMWFGWAGGNIYCFARGQKVLNLRRNPECTVIVDRNEKYPELQAAMFQGRAQLLEDADAEKGDPHLEEVRTQMGNKYSRGRRNDATARGSRMRWIVLAPERVVSWDNTKLKSMKSPRERRAE